MGNIITADPHDLCKQYPLLSLCSRPLHLVHILCIDLNSGIDLDVLTYTSLHPTNKAYQVQSIIINTLNTNTKIYN